MTGLDHDRLALAARAGFHGLLWQGGGAWDERGELPELAEMCKAAGLDLFVEVETARFPLDHPLVAAHPEAFAIRRNADARRPVDPRLPAPAEGEALARLGAQQVPRALEDALLERFARMTGQGARGFRIADAGGFSPAFLGKFIRRLREGSENPTIFADPPGDRWPAGEWRGCAPDFLVSSCHGWDCRQPWLIEEAEELRPVAPLLREIDDGPGDTHLRKCRLMAAAATGSGVILPIGCLAHDDDPQHLLQRTVACVDAVAPFDGPLHRLSATSDPVTALLRAKGGDPRVAEEAMLILINHGHEARPVPAQERLASVGAGFEPTADQDAPLGPGEVRLLPLRRANPVLAGPRPPKAHAAAQSPRLVIEQVTPRVEGGDFPVKRVVGDRVTVEAVIFADGHEQLAAEVHWRACDNVKWSSATLHPTSNDRWTGDFPLTRMGRHEYRVEAWLDRFGGFRRDFGKKLDAGVAQPVDHAEGLALIEQAIGRCKGKLRDALKTHLAAIQAAEAQESARLLLADDLAALMMQADDRPHRLASPPQLVDAERTEARFSSWYELFPRSMTDHPDRHGSFADVIDHLPRVRAMGFDTLYFPPIHPIGKTNRKGPNNTLTPGPDDPGSPYAIGSAEGGHDAIHPELGSFEDFDRLVQAAREQGLEIALDFAIQCSPDHPWLTGHPGWFAWRPDGSMKYAENPPKKYQDIVNVDFYGPDAVPDLWKALRDVILLWVGHGVKTFRVDNPHTKPLPFWEWMIGEVRAAYPDVIFLSEAFTRPAMMYRLAKIGFSQSYTYFTWRERKQELIDYITELTTGPAREFYRPHFFVNTPDINPFFLQGGGRPAHLIRAALAATLSGLWGVYSGFELCDATPLGEGKEEYLDSEKYEVRPRDWNAPGNIVAEITHLNRLRRAHPALQTHFDTRFFQAWNDNILYYGKPSPAGGEIIMAMVSLDPFGPQECDFEVPLWLFGQQDDGRVGVEDLVEGHQFIWQGKIQHIRLTPDAPYRIWRLAPAGEAA